VTAIVQEMSGFQFPESSPALRAYEGRWRALYGLREVRRYRRIRRYLLMAFHTVAFLQAASDKPQQYSRHLFHREHVVDIDVTYRTFRHAGVKRLLRILYDRYTAVLFDDLESKRSIAHTTGKNDADDTRTIRNGGSPEQRVGSGTKTVFARASAEFDVSREDEQVVVGLGYIL